MDELIASLESLRDFIVERDAEKSFTMATAVLLETVKVFGHDRNIMGKTFPMLEQMKNDIRQHRFDDALAIVLAFLAKFRAVKSQYPDL
ncbi:MAG TPA: hypothetical protein VFO40_18555 [Chthoniobacterales bacterium]|nr:hypothetical protein [Chthoniobacterales bacterium]